MNSPSATPEPTEKVPCKLCMSPVPKGAQKCVECGGMQNWQRHITIDNTSIALLIALLSTVGLLATLFEQYLVPEKSDIFAHWTSMLGDEFFFLLVNDGPRSAIVIGGSFFDAKGELIGNCGFRKGSPQGILVEANSSQAVTCYVYRKFAGEICGVSIAVIDYSGEVSFKETYWPDCLNLEPS
jgi:hypothetical protein